MNKTGIFSYCFLITALVIALAVTGHAAELGEYEIKSGMLYNFTLFIEFPEESLDKAKTLTVCIAGDNPSNGSFFRLQGKPYKERTIMVRQIHDPGSIAGCNILFINGSEVSQLPAYLRAAQKRSVLTVSDIDHFAANGGIIGFIVQNRKVRFEINLDAAKQSNIRINSQLLKLARIVAGSKQELAQ